jgi:hypothetical protein
VGKKAGAEKAPAAAPARNKKAPTLGKKRSRARKPKQTRIDEPMLHKPEPSKLGNLGTKWNCFACGAKFYDLNKPDPLCPKCGEDQHDAPKQPSKLRTRLPEPEPDPDPEPKRKRVLDEDEEEVELEVEPELGVGLGVEDPAAIEEEEEEEEEEPTL